MRYTLYPATNIPKCTSRLELFYFYIFILFVFRGCYTPNQKLACFVLYVKIINTFLKNNASGSKLSKELKNGIEILVGQAVFKLWIKTVKIVFWSITQEPLGTQTYGFVAGN